MSVIRPALLRHASVVIGAAALIALVGAASPATTTAAKFGPPWIAIETPVNPYDPATKDAFLLVRIYHHGQSAAVVPTGSAEGIVNGQRRTVALRFTATSREGAFALKKMWGDAGIWTLVIAVDEGEHSVAQALVEVGSDGEVTPVQVPTRAGERGITLPRQLSAQEIDAALRRRAQASGMRE